MSKKVYFFGKKIGMTQLIDEQGVVIPVTVLEAFDNKVIRHKTNESDGYSAMVVGFNSCDKKKLSKPQIGQFKNVAYKYVKEIRVDQSQFIPVDESVNYDSFTIGTTYDIQSRTIGRGFTGAIKAWNHQRGPESHGSKNHRLLGSIGQATTPGRVMKGKKMHTRYGNETVTQKNCILIRRDGNIFYFKGSVPGKNNLVSVFGEFKNDSSN